MKTLILSGLAVLLVTATPARAEPFIRGDVNVDGSVNVSDPVQLLSYLFLGSPSELPCDDAADSDDTGSLSLSDAIYPLNFLFSDGPALPPPTGECGDDPTSDGLECDEFSACGEVSPTPVPTARGGAVAETLDDGIHVIGGGNFPLVGGAGAQVHEVFDPVAGAWSTRAPPPDRFVNHATSAVVDGKIYVIGGDSQPFVREYDPATDAWSYGEQVPRPGTALPRSAVVDGEIYIVGHGFLAVYDPATDAWRDAPDPPLVNPRFPSLTPFFRAAVAIDEKIYAVTDLEPPAEPDPTALLHIYDPATETWTEGAPPPIGVYQPGGIAFGGRLRIFGGTTDPLPSSFEPVAVVQEYDPATDTWDRLLPDLSPPRSLPTAAIYKGAIHLFGGFGDQAEPLDTHDVLR